jgi:hypothetical protein
MEDASENIDFRGERGLEVVGNRSAVSLRVGLVAAHDTGWFLRGARQQGM